jgi:hypothetical protein
VAQGLLQVGDRRLWGQPGIVIARIEDKRLPVIDLINRGGRRLGDDRAARDVQRLVEGPQAGERERLVAWLEDVPSILATIAGLSVHS